MPLPDQPETVSTQALEAWSRLFPDDVERAGAVPPGGFATGTSFVGGPMYVDGFGTKRAPTPWELVEAYKSIIYACVQMNATAVTRIPLRLYVDTASGKKASAISGPRSIGRSLHQHLRSLPYCRSLGPKVDDIEEITNHPLLDAINDPSPVEDRKGVVSYFSREEWLSLICVYCDVIGTHYVKPEGPNGRPPKYLWPLLSQYVIPQPHQGDPSVGRYTYFLDSYEPSELIRFRSASPSARDPYKAAFSPTYAAICYARLEDQFAAIQEQLLAAGPRPNLLVSAKDAMMPPGEPERRRFEQDMERKLAKGNAGRHIVTNGSWDIKPITYSPQDLAGLKISEYDLDRICNCFGIPVAMFSKETNLANLEASNIQHARLAVEPRCRMIASTLTRLAKQYDPRLFFAFDPAVPEDEERQARIWDMKLKNGSATINQANEESPYPPVPWGDEPWIPGSLVQPTMAQEKHQMGLTAQAHDIENQTIATNFQFGEQAEQAEEDVAEQDAETEGEQRSMLIDADGVARFASKGNPYHDDEGKFTGTGGHTGRKPKAPNKGRKPGKEDPTASKKTGGKQAASSNGSKKSEAKNGTEKNGKNSGKSSGQKASGGGSVVDTKATLSKGKDGLTDRERKGKPKELSEKAARAQKFQAKTDSEVQTYTKDQEFQMAKRLGGKAFPDNDPADIHSDIGGGKVRATELKTITHGKNDKVTMKGSALERKVELEKKLGTQMDTVILDHRDRFAGGRNKGLYSGNEIYYKRGVGSFRIGTMYKVKNDAELKKLMRTPYDKLPKEAQGPIRGIKS